MRCVKTKKANSKFLRPRWKTSFATEPMFCGRSDRVRAGALLNRTALKE
jgi:hypothetical protein